MDTANFALPRTYTTTVNKTGKTYVLKLDQMPESSIAFFLEYGIEQKFNDSHSAITKGGKNAFVGSDADFAAAVHAITDDIESRAYAGTLNVRSRRAVDPEQVTAATLSKLWGRTVSVEEVRAMAGNDPTAPHTPTKKKAA